MLNFTLRFFEIEKIKVIVFHEMNSIFFFRQVEHKFTQTLQTFRHAIALAARKKANKEENQNLLVEIKILDGLFARVERAQIVQHSQVRVAG